jgi:hypothetical protein
MKQCLKCGNNLPNIITINGKKHNISNRKFCLDCSPFKAHNTTNLLIHSMGENNIKKCPNCQIEKPIDEFYKRRDHTRKQFSAYCRLCTNNISIERQFNCLLINVKLKFEEIKNYIIFVQCDTTSKICTACEQLIMGRYNILQSFHSNPIKHMTKTN